MLLTKDECYFCHRKKDRLWLQYFNSINVISHKLCPDCYHKIEFETPTYDDIFGHMKYGDHCQILGTTGVGKTNLNLYFFKHTNKRCVWYHSVQKVDAIQNAEIVLDEKDIVNNVLQDVLNKPVYKKIIIIPSVKLSKKQHMSLFETVSDICFEHTDKVWLELMKEKGWLQAIDLKQLEKNKDYIDRAINLFLLNDELMDVTAGATDRDMSNGHYRALHKGRNHGLSMFVSCQRNQDVPKMHCNLSVDTIIFRMKRYDVNALRNSIEYIECGDWLPHFHFVHHSINTGLRFFKPLPLLLWK